MEENKLQFKGFVVWEICAFFFLYEFLLRTVLGTFQGPFMRDLSLTSFQFSLLSSTIFFVIYGLMQIPVGLIVDNIGLKRALMIGIVCCTISTFGFAYAHSYPIAIAYRLLMGLGSSFAFVCLLMSVHEWMPYKYSGIFIGLSQFIGTLGPMVAAGPMDALTESAGMTWRQLFIYLGIVGAILGVLIFFFVENNKKKAGRYTILNKPERAITSFLRLFARLQPLYIALLSASLYFTIEYLSENEGRAFLGLKGISGASASYMVTISWLGYAVGCPLLGFISDMLERRRIMLRVSSCLTLIGILIILYTSGKLSLQSGFFLLGLGASGQSVGFAVMAEQFKKQFVAVGFGLNNAMITLVSGVNAPLIGLFLDSIQQGEHPSIAEYLIVFKIPVLMIIGGGLIAFLLIKETYCKSSVDFTILKPKSVY